MATVLQFRTPQSRIDSMEASLLNRLCGSLQVMWRQGWAERGDPDGVILLQNRACIGVWLCMNGKFAFVPRDTGIVSLRVATVDEAYEATIGLLGDLPPE